MSSFLWLLGALGIGGAGIGAAVLLGGGPAMLLFGGKALAFAKTISPKAWLIIGCIAALFVGFLVHQGHAHKALHRADQAGYSRAMGEMAAKLNKLHAEALAIKKKADDLNAKIRADIRNRNDEEAAHIARRADDLLVRGPGKARCGAFDYPGAAAASGGHVAASGKPDAAVAGMPDAERPNLIALPFAGAVGAAKVCDLNRSEALSWREYQRRVEEAWPKNR